MLINRTHQRWCLLAILITIVTALLYWAYAKSAPNGPTGGSWQGLAFGILGSACMVYAGLLSGRKAVPAARCGSVDFWLKSHIWVGLLSVPLIFFHSGFRFGGLLEQILMACFLLVIFSGIYGLVLQQVLPRLMSTSVPAQAIAEQIPVACQRLLESVEAIVVPACQPALANAETTYTPEKELYGFFKDHVREFLDAKSVTDHPLQNRTYALAQISRLEGSMPERLQPVVQEIRTACEERRQLATQARIQFWLHNWLFLHIPLSLALLVLGLVHAVMSVYY